jgi:phage protein D
VAVTYNNPDARQKLIRKQAGESDFDFLRRIARENAWEMVMDHSASGSLGGRQLRFLSLFEQRSPDVTLKYGQSLIDFTPRISSVGQIAAVSARFWQPEIRTEFTVTVSWDWDRNSLNVSISPGFGAPTSPSSQTDESSRPAVMLVEEPVNQFTAPRVILSKLMARLSRRLTGSGGAVGDPRIQAGSLLRLEGLGERFGGFYRVTSATHTIDSGGYRTNFEVRKDFWFGSIPLIEQGAVRVNFAG